MNPGKIRSGFYEAVQTYHENRAKIDLLHSLNETYATIMVEKFERGPAPTLPDRRTGAVIPGAPVIGSGWGTPYASQTHQQIDSMANGSQMLPTPQSGTFPPTSLRSSLSTKSATTPQSQQTGGFLAWRLPASNGQIVEPFAKQFPKFVGGQPQRQQTVSQIRLQQEPSVQPRQYQQVGAVLSCPQPHGNPPIQNQRPQATEKPKRSSVVSSHPSHAPHPTIGGVSRRFYEFGHSKAGVNGSIQETLDTCRESIGNRAKRSKSVRSLAQCNAQAGCDRIQSAQSMEDLVRVRNPDEHTQSVQGPQDEAVNSGNFDRKISHPGTAESSVLANGTNVDPIQADDQNSRRPSNSPLSTGPRKSDLNGGPIKVPHSAGSGLPSSNPVVDKVVDKEALDDALHEAVNRLYERNIRPKKNPNSAASLGQMSLIKLHRTRSALCT